MSLLLVIITVNPRKSIKQRWLKKCFHKLLNYKDKRKKIIMANISQASRRLKADYLELKKDPIPYIRAEVCKLLPRHKLCDITYWSF